MINQLNLYNLSPNAEIPDYFTNNGTFLLQTCQRTLLVAFGLDSVNQVNSSFQNIQGKDAYQFMLQMICGLESKVIAETEIMAQFKSAYNEYISKTYKNSNLLKILEKLLQDAKEIRTRHLKQVAGQSYASITRQLVLNNSELKKVLIIGSGSLAESILKLFKRKFDCTICARNITRIEELNKSYNCKTYSFEKINNFLQFPIIINTIGTNESIIEEKSIIEWDNSWEKGSVFIDLGSPSLTTLPKVKLKNLFLLDDILTHGSELDKNRQKKVEDAYKSINFLTEKRYNHLSLTRN